MDNYQYYRNGPTFQQSYFCYPFSCTEKFRLQEGNKIIMPPSALHHLTALAIDFPIMFEIRNPNSGRVSHCGVLEFSGLEDVVFMPEWMMQNMRLQQGDQAVLKTVTLQKGIYVKLQPHTTDFTQLHNPKAVLETKLRGFSCLSVGDTFMISHGNHKFYIDVVEGKPSSAICIIDTDCEVDFVTPLDYKEPEKVPAPRNITTSTAVVDQDHQQPEPKFRAFTGTARRLGGGGSSTSESCSPMDEDSPMVARISKDNNDQSNSGALKKSGRLVFGSVQKPKETRKVDLVDETKKKREQKFQAFTGRKYVLG